VSWRMPLLQEITRQYFQHMGGIKATLKAEASSLNCLLISIPIQHKTLSTFIDFSGQYLLWIISRRICITKPWLLEHWVPHCCALNRKHVSKHPWAELVIYLNLYLPWRPFNFRSIISKECQTPSNILHYQRRVLHNLVFFEIMHLETCGRVGSNICSPDLILQGWDLSLRGALQRFGNISFLHRQRLIPVQGFSVTKYSMPIIKASHPISIVNESISHRTDSTHHEKQNQNQVHHHHQQPHTKRTQTNNFKLYLWTPPNDNFKNQETKGGGHKTVSFVRDLVLAPSLQVLKTS
jgi:hypothetical protein